MPNYILRILLTTKEKRTGLDLVTLMRYWVTVRNTQEEKFALQIANKIK